MDGFLQQVVDNMRKSEFEVVELHTAQEACDYLNEHIAAGKTVGVGGSVSVRATGTLEKLQERAAPSIRIGACQRKKSTPSAARPSARTCTFVRQRRHPSRKAGADRRRGQPAAAVCFGPEQVYFVISHSKVVDGGINTAIARIKKTACPPNASRQGLDTACARTGVCGPDCHDSMCRLTLAVTHPGTEDHRAVRGGNARVLIRAIGLPFSCSFRKKTEKPR